MALFTNSSAISVGSSEALLRESVEMVVGYETLRRTCRDFTLKFTRVPIGRSR